jgi:DNA-binding transcriptional LysR family regulator
VHANKTICNIAVSICKIAMMQDWNDLRLVLNVARSGTLQGAADALGINHSTAYRRLQTIEAGVGLRLFDRAGGRYLPTEAGERMAVAAERIEAETLALDRDMTGRDARLSGRLRITASETLAYRALTLILAEFRLHHPGIKVELIIDNRQLDLSRREADVALRATRPTEPDLFGRKIASILWTIYGGNDYLARRGTPATLAECADHDFIGWDDGADTAAARWLAAAIPERAVVYRSSSLVNQLAAAKVGIGLAALPCYLADADPAVRRLMPPITELTRELWLITHQDLRHTARIRAFFDFILEALQRRAIFAASP